jgi:hypothetical protein
MAKKYIVTLSDEECEQLRGVIKRGKTAARTVTRATPCSRPPTAPPMSRLPPRSISGRRPLNGCADAASRTESPLHCTNGRGLVANASSMAPPRPR